MTKNMYLIFDGKAMIYNAPFLMINDAVALRAAQDMVKDYENEVSRNPHDFTMFCIGMYDNNTGQIDLYSKMEVICRFHELPRHITGNTNPAHAIVDQEILDAAREHALKEVR